ncbi:hypothetical protein [Nonlabens sp.]|uniref:hypothetical protein n=1 Tax=Nonlabens sp. TaxID=1888209 RepID=UPI001BCCF287|nr:hypothetical protein [Nonlabens sp.]
MKRILFVFCIVLFASCKPTTSETTETSGDPITSSDMYKKYVIAYNDYASCKMERPQLTTDFMDQKITSEEFAAALERNNKTCNIKKEIFNKYYQLLEAEFDKAAVAHKIMEE